MANDQDIRALQEELRKLRSDVFVARRDIEALKTSQLQYPVDANTQRIVNGLIDTRLNTNLYDTLWKKTFHWYEPFDSITNWDAVNTVIDPAATGAVILETLAVPGSSATLARRLPNYNVVNPFDYDSCFRTSFYIKQGPENAVSLLAAGDGITGGTGVGLNYYGFFIDDGKLFGIIAVGDGTDTWKVTDQIGTIKNHDTSGETYVVEARYYTGVKVEFFVTVYPQGQQVAKISSVPVATLRSTIPRPSYTNPSETPYTFTFLTVTKEAVAKDLYVFDVDYMQRLDLQ